MICINCGKSYEYSALPCPHCGKPAPGHPPAVSGTAKTKLKIIDIMRKIITALLIAASVGYAICRLKPDWIARFAEFFH